MPEAAFMSNTESSKPAYSDLEADPRPYLPEVVSHSDKVHVPNSNGQVDVPFKHDRSNKAFGRLSRRTLIVSALLFLTIVGAIMGGAVGGTIGRRNSASADPKAVSMTSTLYTNTSLAATTLPGGDRRLYFQDASGFIREAQYSAATRDWSASKMYFVTDKAWNGTELAVDKVNITTTQNHTFVRIVLVVASASRGVPLPQVFWLGGPDTQWYNITEWVEPGQNLDLACTPESKFILVLTQNGTQTTGNSTGLYGDSSSTDVSIFYQLATNGSKTSGGTSEIVRYNAISMEVDPPLRMPTVKPGRGFAVEHAISDGRGARIVLPTQADLKESSDDKDGFVAEDIDLWDPANMFWQGLDPPDSLDISLYADVVAFKVGEGITGSSYRVMWLSSNMTLRSKVDNVADTNLEVLDIQLHFPKFAVTKTFNDSNLYLYYQENGTHLAEITFRGGYWYATPTFISIS